MRNHLIQAAVNGIGIIRYVSNALKIMLSIQIKYVYLLVINARLMIILEHALLASKDMT